MKEFPGTHSPARGGRSSSTTPDFAGKERGERRGVMFSEEFLSPLRGSGETGIPSFPGAYATGLMPAALRAGGQKMCVILWVSTPGGGRGRHPWSVSAGGVRSVSAVRAPSHLGLKPQAGEYPPFQGGQRCVESFGF